MKNAEEAAVILAMIIVLGTLIVSNTGSDTPPPAEGDWAISDTTTISDEIVILKGNLTVMDGGILTLDNVDLKMDQDTDFQYHIEVQSGGTLITQNNCHIMSNNGYYYNVIFSVQSTCTIETTTIEDLYESGGYGMTILSNDITINDCDIYAGEGKDNRSGGNAVYIMDSSPLIQNCRIYGGSGQDGIDGEIGTDGSAPGEDGGPGEDGSQGTSGGYAIVIEGTTEASILDCEIFGGDGGAGGAGGRGGHGSGASMSPGRGGTGGSGGGGGASGEGMDAIRIISGSPVITGCTIVGGDGGFGGAGGNGGNGGTGQNGVGLDGDGGIGGDGGSGSQGGYGIYIESESSSIIRDCSITGGNGGDGGVGGYGGNGGRGLSAGIENPVAGDGGDGGNAGSGSNGGPGSAALDMNSDSIPIVEDCLIIGGIPGVGGDGGNGGAGGDGGSGGLGGNAGGSGGNGGNGASGGSGATGASGIEIGSMCSPTVIGSEIEPADGSSGGKGGDGGDGGDSGFSEASTSGAPGNGGNGLNGGDGGDGGSGIYVRASLPFSIYNNSIFRGVGGLGGNPGLGGLGGDDKGMTTPPGGFDGTNGSKGSDGNNATSLDIGDSSGLTAVNTTLQEPKISFEAFDDSYFNYAWFLNVHVTNMDMDPIEGASVSLMDLDGIEVFSGLTGASGYIKNIICIQYNQTDINNDNDGDDPGEITVLTPHSVNASLGEAFNETQVTMDSNVDLELRLGSMIPFIEILEPDGVDDIAHESYIISWQDSDPDSDSEIFLFHDTDDIGFNGQKINAQPISEDDLLDEFTWNTINMDEGSYYIYASIDDGINALVYDYGAGPLIVDHPNVPPTVEIESPTGGIVSGTVVIEGVAEDPDNDNVESVYVSIDSTEVWDLAVGTTSWSYSWDTTEFSDGKHTIYAKAYDGEDSSAIADVVVTVDNGGNAAPQVNITYPDDNSMVSGDVTITGSASDEDGTVVLVQIRIDNCDWYDAEGTSTWSHPWNTLDCSNGEHTIKARAKDDLNLYSHEESITVIVDNGGNIPPTIEITSHSGGEVVNEIIEIKGNAIDYDGDVELVEVKIDDESWDTAEGTTSWIYEWNTNSYSNGEHLISVQAMDDEDDYSQIVSITLIVNNGGENVPPIVNIISPLSGTVSGNVTIRGSASDLDGDSEIAYVEVKIDDDWNTAQGTTDWSHIWDTTSVDDDDYTIQVRAYDGKDYSMIKTVDVTVDNPHEPVLTITSNIPGTVKGTLILQGTASDIDGEVVTIEVQIDDGVWVQALGTTNWSFEIDTTELSDGDHTLSIRATDDEGDYSQETITFTVKNAEDADLGLLALILILVVLTIGIILIIYRKRGTQK